MLGRAIMANAESQRGFVLVPAVWLAGVIAIALSMFLTEIRLDTRLTANLVENTRAELRADGMARQIAYEIAAGPGVALSMAETPHKCRLDTEFSAIFKVQDQSGLVDLNAASPITLRELARVLKVDLASAHDFADRILDFRDRDDSPQPKGAETAEYRAANSDHLPKNRPFEHASELDQVLGMNERLRKLLYDKVTVYSGQDGIDPRVAPAQLKSSDESKFPKIVSQQQSFAIDVLVFKREDTGFHRRAIIRVLRRPEKPFAILEWETGNADAAAQLRRGPHKNCS
jgi:general secretion pathway protein K